MNLQTVNEEFISFSDSILNSSRASVNDIAALLPKALLAILVFLIGWLIGIIIEWMFIKMGEKLKLNTFWEKTGLNSLLKKADIKSNPSKLAGTFLKSIIVMFFLRESMSIMGFVEIEEFIQKIINLAPDIIIALFILLFSINAAGTASSLVKNLMGIGDANSRKIMALVAKNILIAFGVMAALVQVHIAADMVQTLFTAFVAMLALAGGLALGLGGKDFVHEMIEDVRKKKMKKK
jgi:hypothetical protein